MKSFILKRFIQTEKVKNKTIHNYDNPTYKIIYVCSPLKGDIEKNRAAAAQYCNSIIKAGFIPFAPHLYFTIFLDDLNAFERKLGQKKGFEVLHRLKPGIDELWVFGKTISEGMKAEIELAQTLKIDIKYIKT